MTVVHITDKKNVESIIENGFKAPKGSVGRIYFCKPESVCSWVRILEIENFALLEIEVTPDFYLDEFYDWDFDEYTSGSRGQITYGEGPLGWNFPEKRPILKPGVNCTLVKVWNW